MTGCERFAVVTALFFACGTVCARAEGIETTVAVSVDALSGDHEVSRGTRDKLVFAPLPLAEITFRRGAQSLRVEGLPPITFGYLSKDPSTETTRLSILNATLRSDVGRGFFVGIGTTVYNQRTDYGSRTNEYLIRDGAYIPITGELSESSRVTGARFEIGQSVAIGNNRLEYDAAVNPRMHGIDYTHLNPTFVSCQFTSAGTTCYPPSVFADGENASQIDVMARLAHRVSKHGELLVGLRYLNYVARYDAAPGQLADRNVGYAPSLGYRVRL